MIVPGGVLGLAAVLALLGWGPVPLNGSEMVAAAWPVALAVVVVAVFTCAVVAWRAAARGFGPVHGDSGRARTTVTIGTTVLVASAAALWLASRFTWVEVRSFDGKEYVLERALSADLSILRADKADRCRSAARERDMAGTYVTSLLASPTLPHRSVHAGRGDGHDGPQP